MKIVDLSHTIVHEMSSYPGSPFPKLQQVAQIETDGFREKQVSLSTHVGTHIDAPAHMLEEGAFLDEFAADTFIGAGYAMTLSSGSQNDLYDSVKRYLDGAPHTRFILFATGWDTFWGDEKYFYEYPTLSLNVSELIAKRKLAGVGFDTPSADRLLTTDYLNHSTFFKANILILENLKNVNLLVDKEFELFCLPLKIEKSDGAPARVIARILS